jgi:hypothetical protein
VVTGLVVELPRLRPGDPPERLEVEGRGVEVLASGLRTVSGSETRWNVRLRADAQPGNVALLLRAVYGDGRSVEVKDALTVVPRDEATFPWVGVAGVLVAFGLAAAALVVARRRSW